MQRSSAWVEESRITQGEPWVSVQPRYHIHNQHFFRG